MSFKCGGFDGGLHEKSWPDGRKKPWYEYCSTISSLKCVLVNSAQSNESAWQRGIRREKKRKPLDVLLTPMCSHPLDKCPSPKYQPLLCRRQIVCSAAGNQLPLTLVAQISVGNTPHLIKIPRMLCSLKSRPWSQHNTCSKVGYKSGKNTVLDWSGEVEFCSCFPWTSPCLLHGCISVKACRLFSKHNTSPGGIWSQQF